MAERGQETAPKVPDKKLTLMVSSTVYGIEELLERVYAVLTEYGYDVWMSHKGTLPVTSTRSAFENCLHGVEQCDLFLGLITPHYGSGRETKADLSITHEELLRAIELNKPRWILAHDHVVFARTLLTKLGFEGARQRSTLRLTPSPVIDDLRVIDMYEAAIRHDVEFADRKGNWVQKFVSKDNALLYASAQFFRYQEAEQFLKEHLGNPSGVSARLREGNKS